MEGQLAATLLLDSPNSEPLAEFFGTLWALLLHSERFGFRFVHGKKLMALASHTIS
jgi:hypothetical protein